MRATELEHYLHEHIPLSAAMGVVVREAVTDAVILEAPLEPNINHRDTVFGGSASAVAILAAWSLVRVRLDDPATLPPRIVIQRNTIEYERPITGTFTARSYLVDPERWDVFRKSLARHGRGRVKVGATLESAGERVATFEGDFVAIRIAE